MIRWRLGIIFFQTVLPAANVGPAYLRCFIFGLRSCLLLNSRRELFVGFLPKLIIFAQFVLCPAYKWRCRKSQLKPKDFLWKRLEVTSLRKGSKSPFFRIGYLLKNISKQFNSFPKNRRSRSRNSYILFLLHLRAGLFAVQFTTYIMFKVQKLLWDYSFDEYLICFVFPPFTDKVVFSYYAALVE